MVYLKETLLSTYRIDQETLEEYYKEYNTDSINDNDLTEFLLNHYCIDDFLIDEECLKIEVVND